MKLSNRLLAVAGLVTPGHRLADVGTDHGYIPIYLVEHKLIPAAIAMDVNKGPLERAKEHIEEENLEVYITTRLSDGVSQLKKDEVDTVLIAGMGGSLVIKILTEGREVLSSVKELILQPQSDLDKVRRYLLKNGYRIVTEDMVFEDGKYYPMMRVIHGTDEKKYSESYYRYGGFLIRQNHPVLKQYLEKEEKQLLAIKRSLEGQEKQERIEIRMKELEHKLAILEEARLEMQKNEV